MSAEKLVDMLCTSIKDVNEMLGMSADNLASGRSSLPLCKHTTEQVGLRQVLV